MDPEEAKKYYEFYLNDKIEKRNLINNSSSYSIKLFEDLSSIPFVQDESDRCNLICTNINKMFYKCLSLKSLSAIDKLNINNVTDMSEMFYRCTSLISLPDISKWHTDNVTDMEELFYECSSLITLPDISKWNIGKVSSIYLMFYKCESLISLPDISKWNTDNVTDMSFMFYGCSLLISLPDLSIWNTKDLINISSMFSGCSSLISLPYISHWNTEKINNMNSLFDGCSSLKSLPDISKWNMKNMKNISEMFKGCSSLISLPDISKWNLKNINDLSSLFEGCSSLISLNDISKWNISNLYDYSRMFNGCTSLKTFPDISKFINKSVFNLTIIGQYNSLPEIKLEEDIKIVLCGATGVGCNTLSKISIGEEFKDNSEAIFSFQYKEIKFFVNYKEIKISLWNGPGQEKYRSMLKILLNGADIIIFVYCINDINSFKDLYNFIKMAEDNLENNFIGAIVANKSDLFLEQEVDEEQGEKLAMEKNYKFYLVSAKDNQQAFINCLDDLVKDYILTKYPHLLTINKNDKNKIIK